MPGTLDEGFGFKPKLIAAAVCFALYAPHAISNPTGATVVSGSAGIAAAGNTLTVTNSANAIINWQAFSIGVNEITRFQQSSASSAVLNRVIGTNGVVPQSVIDGMLSSNGRVFLLNPMGIVIGASARIDAAGLIASTLNLSDQDFLKGTLRFTEVPGAGAVVNHGIIETASGGRVFLVAPQVENSGIIRAPQGEIVLAAGKSADLVSESSPYVTVRVVADTQQALNVGSLIADSGRIGMYGALLRNSGVAEANGASLGPGGQIRFVASKDLTLDAGSRVSANGTSGGQVVLQAEGGTNLIAGTVEATGSAGTGGSVQALGVRVGVIGHGVIDASGETGGGTVLVGGDYQGKNGSVQNAQSAEIGADGVIRADAGTTGDGGRVIVWADGDTQFHGSVSARGGAKSGDGGFVETSGKEAISIAGGRVVTRAPNGRSGTWFVDPADFDIDQTVADAISYGVVNNGTFSMSGQDVNFLVNLNTAAYGGGSSNLSLTATNNINFNTFNITTQGTSVSLTASSGSITSSTGGGNITTNGASVYLSAGTSVNVGAINTAGGTGTGNTYVEIYSSNGPITAGAITTGSTTSSSSYVEIYANSGTVTTGAIQTGSSAYESYVDVETGNTGGSILVNGPITTGGGSQDSSVYMYSSAGGITVNGSITTADSRDYTYVYLHGNNGSVTVNGSIKTGSTDGSEGGQTYVDIYAGNGSVSVGGSITTGNANVSSSCCWGDAEGYVSLQTYSGSISVGGPITTGNAFSAYGGSGYAYSYVDLYAPNPGGSISVNGPIKTGTADATYGVDSGTYIQAGNGISVNGSITTGNATSHDTGGFEYAYSTVDIQSVYGGNITIGGGITTGNAYVVSGFGSGDSSVSVSTPSGDIKIGGPIKTGLSTGIGYYGGPVYLATDAGSIRVNGMIDTHGADGANDGSGADGGSVELYASNSVIVGPPGTPGVYPLAINTAGGNGNGAGAYGGHGGSVIIDPNDITVSGTIQTIGGQGGPGGAGGDAGSLWLLTPNKAGTITFVNGGYDATGGTGSPAGASAIPYTPGSIWGETPQTLRIDGSLIFITLQNDALSDPAVAQAVGQTIQKNFGSCKAT